MTERPQPDIDYHEFAIDSLTRGLNKLEEEYAKLRKDTDDVAIWTRETCDWSGLMHEEMEKHKKSDRYFQSSLKDTHKQYYEKFETLFKRVFGKRKTDAVKKDKYISYNK